MGCDIHMIVQRKRDDISEGYWSTELPPAWWPRDEWDAEKIAYYTSRLPDANAAQRLARYTGEWYGDRNYDLFGILAGVRSYDWPIVVERRGLPPDVSADDREHYLGDHSFTWMTLREVLAYPWDTAQATGYFGETLTARQACEWWCETILPAFVRLAEEWGVSHDDVRLVMGFDS